MINKYILRSRISEKKFREILRLFCLNIEAKQTAEINKIFDKIRDRIVEYCEQESPFAKGEIELD